MEINFLLSIRKTYYLRFFYILKTINLLSSFWGFDVSAILFISASASLKIQGEVVEEKKRDLQVSYLSGFQTAEILTLFLIRHTLQETTKR